jgi:hypothetical protein
MTTDTHQQLMLEKVKCEEGEVLRFPMLSEPCGCFDSLIALKCRPCSREEWKTLDGTAHVDACDRCHSGRIPVRTLEAVLLAIMSLPAADSVEIGWDDAMCTVGIIGDDTTLGYGSGELYAAFIKALEG